MSGSKPGPAPGTKTGRFNGNQWTNVAMPEDPILESLRDLDDLVAVRRALVDNGVSDRTAERMIGWLMTRWAGEDNTAGGTTVSRYRRTLAELAPIILDRLIMSSPIAA